MNGILGIILIIFVGCSNTTKKCFNGVLYECDKNNLCVDNTIGYNSKRCIDFNQTVGVAQTSAGFIKIVKVDDLNKKLLEHNLEYSWSNDSIIKLQSYVDISREHIIEPSYKNPCKACSEDINENGTVNSVCRTKCRGEK